MSGPVWNRLIGPVLFGLALAAVVELAIELRYHPDFWQKTTWLVHDPYHGETFDRVMLYERLSNLDDSRPEVISVGDSSGFFGIQSTIANRYTHGVFYLSLNTGANYVYLGYRALAEYMLRKPGGRIKWVIIYAFPQLMPEESVLRLGDLAPYVDDDLIGPLSVLTPPSAFLSPYAKYKIFDNANWHFGSSMVNDVAPLQLRAQVKQALGWLPEFDVRYDRVGGQFPFPYYRDEDSARPADARSGILPRLGLAQNSSIYAVYDDFNRMVKSYGAHLAIAFAPVSERAISPKETHIAEAEAAMARFSRDNPDVKFLFPYISTWAPEKFGTANHISREYTFLSSMRLGKAIGRLVTDPGSIPNYVPRFQGISLPHVTHTITGPVDAELLKSAFAFYLYTQTLDESYKRLISRRVLDLLEHDEAYHYMMQDAAARARMFADKKIEIGFDMSQMRARPLVVSGMPFCNQRPETQWVQVDGVLNFTYKSPEIAPPATPVRWPEGSNIYFPLIKEDGIYKFDGYCPESDLALANAGDPILAKPQ
jgi:hypothetical protein